MISKLIFATTTDPLVISSVFAIAGFVIGFISKATAAKKQRKRILQLEDEMLASHSRILSLEKRIADYKSEKNTQHQDFELITHKTKDQNLRVS